MNTYPLFPAADALDAADADAYFAAARATLGDGSVVRPTMATAEAALAFPAFPMAVSITNGQPNYTLLPLSPAARARLESSIEGAEHDTAEAKREYDDDPTELAYARYLKRRLRSKRLVARADADDNAPDLEM
jgi:hypothetical protein